MHGDIATQACMTRQGLCEAGCARQLLWRVLLGGLKQLACHAGGVTATGGTGAKAGSP